MTWDADCFTSVIERPLGEEDDVGAACEHGIDCVHLNWLRCNWF
jgi:hypothetical protein